MQNNNISIRNKLNIEKIKKNVHNIYIFVDF